MIRFPRLIASIAFYTCLPVPSTWSIDFQGIARFAPLVGIFIGSLLGLLNLGLQFIGIPLLPCSAVIVIAWVGITGGLHLDGAMDTADGLAVTEPNRRLEVMADSATGAFGAMAAISIVLLKTTAITDLDHFSWLTLSIACGWGRWAQQVAIIRYSYLKPTGKGAFHKESLQSIEDILPSLLLLLGLCTFPLFLATITHQPLPITYTLLSALGGLSIALLVPAYFNHKLGGHTGDTYGAVVEWTEALLLVLLTIA